MTADSKALPEITITPRDIPTEAQPSLVYSVPGEYDDEFLSMTEEHLAAVLAAMKPDQRARVLGGFAGIDMVKSVESDRAAIRQFDELQAELAAERAKVAELCSFLGFPVPPSKTPHEWLDTQVRSLKRNADWETQEHARHHQVEEDLRATLAKVEAERAHEREAAELMRLPRSTPGWHDRALAWRTKDEGTRQ